MKGKAGAGYVRLLSGQPAAATSLGKHPKGQLTTHIPINIVS